MRQNTKASKVLQKAANNTSFIELSPAIKQTLIYYATMPDIWPYILVSALLEHQNEFGYILTC